jgi:hypothetical protein
MKIKNTVKLIEKSFVKIERYDIVFEGKRYIYTLEYDTNDKIVSDYIRDEKGYEISDPSLAENIVGYFEEELVTA